MMKVMMMVAITLVDIVGYLYFWDITIDIVSCINIVISVGLCVDYSVHIGHCFVVRKGFISFFPPSIHLCTTTPFWA